MTDAKQPIHMPNGPLQWLLALGGLLHTDQVEAAVKGDKATPMTQRALADIRQALSDPQWAASQATLFEGFSDSEGILIVHRSPNIPWRVCVCKQLPDGNGNQGEILHAKPNGFIRWMAKDAEAATKTIQRILLAPDLRIVGTIR